MIINVYAEEPIPVDITSDEMQWDDDKRIAYAIGNAVAIQGQRKIAANKLIVHLEKNKNSNEIVLIKAEGNVIFTSIDEIENNVTLKKNDNIMKGEFLEMDLNTGISQIRSKKDSDKVKMRFLPKKSDEE